MLLEEIGKGGDGDVEGVFAIVVDQVVDVQLTLQALGILEDRDLGRLVEGIDEWREAAEFGVVDVAPLLEQKRDFFIIARLHAFRQHDPSLVGHDDDEPCREPNRKCPPRQN